MAVNQTFGPQFFGWLPSSPTNSTSTQQLNGSASGGWSQTWLAYQFIAPAGNKSVTEVSAYISNVIGTLGANDLQCDVMIDSNGIPGTPPGSSIGNSNTLAGGAPSSAGWIRFTGITGASTTFGTAYWLLFRNGNGTPTSNYPQFRFTPSNSIPFWDGGSTTFWSLGKKVSTDGGSTWTAGSVATIGGWRIKFSDGSYWGFPVQNAAAGTDKVFSTGGTGYLGMKFTTPPGAQLNVTGMTFYSKVQDSSSGNRVVAIYLDSGTGSLGAQQGSDANVVLNGIVNAGGSGYYHQKFPSVITLQPATSYRAVIRSSAGSSTSYHSCPTEYTIDSDSNSLAILPGGSESGGATFQKTYWNGSAWTDTNTSLLPFALTLDNTGEFTASGSGAGAPAAFIARGANIPLF
jgi:hypothetical protein